MNGVPIIQMCDLNKPLSKWQAKKRDWGFPWKFVNCEGLIIDMPGTKYGKDKGEEPVSCAGRHLVAESTSKTFFVSKWQSVAFEGAGFGGVRSQFWAAVLLPWQLLPPAARLPAAPSGRKPSSWHS